MSEQSEGMGIDWPSNDPPTGRIDIAICVRTHDGDVLSCVIGAASPEKFGDGALERAIKVLLRIADVDAVAPGTKGATK